MIFIRYNTATGEIGCRCDVPDSAVEHQTGDDLLWVDADQKTQYIDLKTRQPVPFPEQPSAAHQWDWTTRTWRYQNDVATQQARARRAALLAASDWTQLPDVPLTTKTAWAEYRQALREVPEQPGFPTEITWPTPP